MADRAWITRWVECSLHLPRTASPKNQDGHMEHKSRPAQVSISDLGRFIVSTRRGRVSASVFVAAAALLGLGLGVLGASETVSTVAVVVFVAIAVPVILLQAVKATRPPHVGPE